MEMSINNIIYRIEEYLYNSCFFDTDERELSNASFF